MFDRIAPRYDLLNRLLSLGLDRAWRRRAVAALQLRDGARVLDVASGTGDVALEVLRQVPGARVDAIDPAPRMLERARRKLDRAGAGARVALALGDAGALPYADESFDGAIVAFGVRNFPDRERALREMARVTRPGGRVVVLELMEPRHGLLGALARFYCRRFVPAAGALLSGEREYRYLQQSMAAFPPPAEFAQLLGRAGLSAPSVEPLTFGVSCLFVARRPGA
ncbi:MAG: ubiquinone/menaquinone biosynthesis methyltransferase [Acidobacteria bacterium]|nr:ubiquinone/menaquinone biosynthesis methyltransferase [Acidobacteriota bacterium]